MINIDDETNQNCYGYLKMLKVHNSITKYILHKLKKTTPEKPVKIDIYNQDQNSYDSIITQLLGFDYAAPAPDCWKTFLNMKIDTKNLHNVSGIVYIKIIVDVGDTPH